MHKLAHRFSTSAVLVGGGGGAAHHPDGVGMHLLSFPQSAAETRGRGGGRGRSEAEGVQRSEIIPSSTAEQGAAARNLLLLLRLFLGSSNVTAGGEDAEVLLRAG